MFKTSMDAGNSRPRWTTQKRLITTTNATTAVTADGDYRQPTAYGTKWSKGLQLQTDYLLILQMQACVLEELRAQPACPGFSAPGLEWKPGLQLLALSITGCLCARSST